MVQTEAPAFGLQDLLFKLESTEQSISSGSQSPWKPSMGHKKASAVDISVFISCIKCFFSPTAPKE